MATAALTQPRRARRVRWNRWLTLIVVVLVLLVAGIVALNATSTPATTGAAPYVVARGSIAASVAGSGSVATTRIANLSFSSAGTVSEVRVAIGDVVTGGQVLARIDDSALALQLAGADAQLASAQAQLDELTAGPSMADLTSAKLGVINAELQVDQLTQGPTAADLAGARSSLVTAQANLAALKAGSDPVEIQNARNALEQAKNSLYSQQLSRDATCARPDQSVQCKQANASVGNAEIQVRAAQAALDRLIAGPDATEMQVALLAATQANARLSQLTAAPAAKEIEAAQLQLENAKARLDELNAGPAAADLAKAQVSVEQAKYSRLQAQTALDNATLRAPYDGVVTAVNLTAGSSSGTGTAVTVVNRGELHVDLKLSENDAVKVQAGQSVTLTIDSLNGKAVRGTVAYVSPVAESTNGVVTYAVRVGLSGDDAQIRIGMTANVLITTAQKDNVLLVPNTALLPQGNGYVVRLLSRASFSGTPGAGRPDFQGTPGAQTPGAQGNGTGQNGQTSQATRVPGQRRSGTPFPGAQNGQANPLEVQVQIGLSDGTYTEILSGLREGDNIVALASSASSTQRQSGGLFGFLRLPGIGGGFAGPGAPGR